MAFGFGVLPLLVANGDGSFTILGGGKATDVTIDGDGAARKITFKRDGTLLDSLDATDGIAAAGSALIAQSFGLNTALITSDTALSSQTLLLVMVNVPFNTTVTGVMFVQSVMGTYTANNYNGIGLYSYDGAGTLTLVASSTNDGTIWSNSGDTIKKKPFSATAQITAGSYWIAALFCASSVSVSPKIAAAPAASLGTMSALDFTNSALTYGAKGAVTGLPATQVFSSGVGGTGIRPWFALY